MNVKDKELEARSEREGLSDKKAADIRRLIKRIIIGAMYGVWGYFLGGLTLPFGALPFGAAFLCAADRRVFYIYAGLCIGAIGREDGVLLFCVYTALIFTRILIGFAIAYPRSRSKGIKKGDRTIAEIYPLLFCEGLSLRMSVSATGAFAIGLYKLLSRGMLFYDLYGTVISVVAAPLSVLIVYGVFSKRSEKYTRLLGILAIAFGVISAVGDAKLYGISLAAAGCMFVTLWITHKEGTVPGILSGALLGLAMSIEMVPVFSFAALSFGLLSPISVSLAAGGALAISLAWGVYVDGIGILNGLASALVSSSLIYTVYYKLFLSERRSKVVASEAKVCALPFSEKEELCRAQLEDTQKRITHLKDGFESVSKILSAVGKRLHTPGAADIKQICDNAFDSCCASCEGRNSCWKDRYRETSAALSDISAVLQRKGSISAEDVDRRLVDECPRLSDIISEINHNTFAHMRQLSEGDRTELFVNDYAATAEFISFSERLSAEEYEPDTALGEKLLESLTADGSDSVAVLVYGKQQRHVSVYFEDRRSLISRHTQIAETLSEVCPFALDGGIIDPQLPIIRFTEKAALSVSVAKRNIAAEGEEQYCGDTSGTFKTDNGRIYSFISDGMGSGREAALTSGIVGVYLKKFLSGYTSADLTVRLVNGFLRNRCAGSLYECSATVDLLELDLLRSKACFYKCGAAPTYVFRNGSLFKLRSHTVPIGIIAEPDLRRIDFDVSAGDIVVMVSDGVTDGKEECPWLFDLLRSQSGTASPQRLADLTIKYAKAKGCRDDLSVIVIKIE